jgi:hypothetical protein
VERGQRIPDFEEIERAWRRPRRTPSTPVNDDGREIWFKRFLWSWIPCHWKGWAMIFGFVAGSIACFWLLAWITGELGKPKMDWPYLVLPPAIVMSWWMADRHSPSRKKTR